MNPEEQNDPVWRLLGASPPPAVNPDFLQSVVQAASGVPQERPEVAAPALGNVVAFQGRKIGWWIGISAAAAALIAGLFIAFRTGPEPEIVKVEPPLPQQAPASGTTQDFVVEDTFEQELVAVDGITALIEVQEVSQLDDAELLALIN